MLKSDVCNGFGNRIYAITGRNRLLIAPLLALILAQLGFGIYSVVWVAVRPSELLDHPSILVRTQ